MTPEDEEFNRIEMESKVRQEHITQSGWRKRLTQEQSRYCLNCETLSKQVADLEDRIQTIYKQLDEQERAKPKEAMEQIIAEIYALPEGLENYFSDAFADNLAKVSEAQPKQEQGEPVALVTGVYGGRFTYAPFKESLILPVGMALYSSPQQRTWVGLMRGVRVEGNAVVITVKGGNDEARALCGELINEMEKNTQ
jgi:hypothetical protein